MKKKIAAAMVMLLACMVVLVGCGGNNSGNGGDGSNSIVDTTWALDGGSQNGVTVDKAALEQVLGGEITYTFKADGKATVSLSGVSADISWKQDGNKITIDDGTQSVDFTLEGDKLTGVQGDVTMIFKKK